MYVSIDHDEGFIRVPHPGAKKDAKFFKLPIRRQYPYWHFIHIYDKDPYVASMSLSITPDMIRAIRYISVPDKPRVHAGERGEVTS